MDHGAFVDAIEFPIVDLVTVTERSARGRQRAAIGPHPRLASASGKALRCDELRNERPAASGYADAQRVEQENLGGIDGRRRQIVIVGGDDVLRKTMDGVHEAALVGWE